MSGEDGGRIARAPAGVATGCDAPPFRPRYRL
jgi:hypothetical protein